MAENRNSRLKKALKEAKISQEKLGIALGISSQAVSERLNKDEEIDSVEFLNAVAKLTNNSIQYLITGVESTEDAMSIHLNNLDDLNKAFPAIEVEKRQVKNYNKVEDDHSTYLSGKIVRPITVVVNAQGKELMSYVNIKAQAGYMKGFGDPHYVEKLPAFNLPIMKEGSYRMFEVDGDSMLQIGGGGLHNGDIVISQYLEDIFSMRDNRVYVVISTEGVCVKRCINRLKDTNNPVLILNSDNKNGQHPAIILRPNQIIEVWELKAFISRQLSFATDLWEVINDLQVKQALLTEKVNGITGKMLNP